MILHMTILTQNWNGSSITFAANDLSIARFRIPKGYVNATQMCKANGKLWGHYKELKSTKAYWEALSDDIGITISLLDGEIFASNNDAGIPVSLIIEIEAYGSDQGTWVHPEIAIDLAAWISPRFRVWVNRQIRTLLETGRVEIPQPLTLADKLAQAEKSIDIAERYKGLFGSFNPQTEAYLKDIIGNVLMETNNLLGGTTELWMGVVNFAQVELGHTVPKKGEYRDSALGTWIRFYYPSLSDKQERRFCNETHRDIWVYPIHDCREELAIAVEAFFAEPAPGTKLKLEGAFKRK
jgi:hypothetical protein